MGRTKAQIVEVVRQEEIKQKICSDFLSEKDMLKMMHDLKNRINIKQHLECERLKDNPFIGGNMEAIRESKLQEMAKTWSLSDAIYQIVKREFKLTRVRERAEESKVDLSHLGKAVNE